ncbi:MAG TPA: three-Cys-motif partner protein TcmP [Thermoanaerobacterales bacterium]|nr:three-Cys-motif partner protein TcmP [Thermoanaerobacterales bacterium]
MALKDSSPEKWVYKEHTRIKHNILMNYLSPWMVKLGKYYRHIIFVDGFAGRGEYFDENGKLLAVGSPIKALQVANSLLEKAKEKNRPPYFDNFTCICLEKDTDNYKNLKEVLSREYEKLKFKNSLDYILKNDEFALAAEDIIRKIKYELAPSFFFIDPFGFSGVPFKLIKEILSLPRTEVFFNLMTRDINRFLNLESNRENLRSLYSNMKWKDICSALYGQERDVALKNLFIENLYSEGKSKYVSSFRMCMNERYQTLYYLIHATNHFDGFKIMKDIMFKQSSFGNYEYSGPYDAKRKGQISLFDLSGADYVDTNRLEKILIDRYKNKYVKWEQILKDIYKDTEYIETHIRKAVNNLIKKGLAFVEKNTENKKVGKIGPGDMVKFL